MKKPFYVYVAGPLTTGLTTHNVREATLAAAKLMDLGMVPFLPHTNVLAEMIAPRSEREWLEDFDFPWLRKCDAMLRLPGMSRGADEEEQVAKMHGIPVFHTLEELVQAYDFFKARHR